MAYSQRIVVENDRDITYHLDFQDDCVVLTAVHFCQGSGPVGSLQHKLDAETAMFIGTQLMQWAAHRGPGHMTII